MLSGKFGRGGHLAHGAGHALSAPKVYCVDGFALQLQVVEELALVPIEMLDHLKEMPPQNKARAGSPRSLHLTIAQIVLASLGNHLEGNGFVLEE